MHDGGSSEAQHLDDLRERQLSAWECGERLLVEALIDGMPSPLADNALLELIYAEVMLRSVRGEVCLVDEYVQRFPQFVESLQRLFAIHEALDSPDGAPSDVVKSPHVKSPQIKSESRSSDRNLLFGIVALQMEFISRDALIEALRDWTTQKEKPLGQVLVERGDLSVSRRELLEPLVDEHVRQHDHDPSASLASISSISDGTVDWHRVHDVDVAESLAARKLVRGRRSSDGGSQTTQGSVPSGVSRFRVLRPHAEGGLGIVCLARDEELHREVALKEIKPQFAKDVASRNRFTLEAEITGGLEHPGIVPVYGLGQYSDGRPYYAMRFIRGDSLKEAIERFHAGPQKVVPPAVGDVNAATVLGESFATPSALPAEAASRAVTAAAFQSVEFRKLLGRFIDVCQAIEYAHSRGVLHRDLKPGNIMLGKYGETLVVDWGLAKAAGKDERFANIEEATLVPSSGSSIENTADGSVIGTPAYMSPEQASGRLEQIGPATDVYSLGATLYHVLTGRSSFAKLPLPELLKRVQSGQFPRPRQINTSIPKALEAICLKAMSLNPVDRYESATGIAEDIEHWLADEPVNAFKESSLSAASRWVRKHRAWALAGSATAVLVAIVATVSSFIISGQNDVISTQRKLAERHLYLTRMKLAQAAWENGSVDETRRLIEMTKDGSATSSKKDELRGFEWYFWDRLSHSAVETWYPKGFNENAVCSGDGQRVLMLGADGNICVWNTKSGTEEAKICPKRDNYFTSPLAISRDGNIIVASRAVRTQASIDQSAPQDTVWESVKSVIAWDGMGRELFQLEGFGNRQPEISLSENGKMLAVAGRGKLIELFDGRTGKKVNDLSKSFTSGSSFVLTNDGHEVLVEDAETGIHVFDSNTGTELRKWIPEFMVSADIAFSPDGKRFAQAVFGSNVVSVNDAETGEKAFLLTGHDNEVSHVAWSQDGKRIATASEDHTIRVWDALKGSELLELKGHAGPVISVGFSLDRLYLTSVSSDQSIKVWDAVQGQAPQALSRHDEQVLSVAFHPDGKTIATSSGRNGLVKIWDVSTGNTMHVLPGHKGLIRSIVFSPDGQLLATSAEVDSQPFGGIIYIWSSSNGELLFELKQHTHWIAGLAFSPNGKHMASCGYDGSVRIWNTQTWKEDQIIGQDERGPVQGVVFHPSSTKFAAIGSGGNFVKVFELGNPRELLKFNPHLAQTNWLSYSPDGQLLATASWDKTIRLWNANDGRLWKTLTGHAAEVNCAVFSPDGQRIASGSKDRSVKVWDVMTGIETLTLKGHSKDVHCVSFSPDGRQLASSSSDGTVKIWDAHTASTSLSEQIQRSREQLKE